MVTTAGLAGNQDADCTVVRRGADGAQVNVPAIHLSHAAGLARS